VTNTGSGSTGTSAVNIVLPNAMAGHDVTFRWRHGSDRSVMEEGGGWWLDAWLGGNGIFNANPATGVQHARVLSKGGNYPIHNASALISPTFAQGATQYSIATAKMAIGNIGTGSSWFFKPVNEELTPPITYVKFDRGTRAIAVYDAAVGGFVDTGALWPDAAYFEVKIVVERATKALRVCLNGATMYTGVAGNAHMRLLEFGGVMESGSNGSTFDVDDVTLDNINTDGGCTP